jgi:hypothetical protein
MDRDCAESQSQHIGRASLLRLVFDTAALQSLAESARTFVMAVQVFSVSYYYL